MLGVVYAPPNSDYFDALEQLLDTHLPEYEHAVLMGDFNTCLLQHNVRSRKLLSLTTSLNLHIPKLDPTHHVNDSHTLIDHIITSNKERIASHGQFTASGFSHHDLIFASYKLKVPKPKPKIIFQRSFARMDQEKLAKDAANTDWSQIEGMDSIDDMVKCFNSLVTDLLVRHAPLHPVRMKRPPAPWLTAEIRRQMAHRDALRRKHKKDPSETNWNHFKRARTFPLLWKYAFMVPVPKISDPVEFKHYRPISILPFLSKVLERLSNLSWELQVSEVSRKIYASMHGLKRLQNFLPYSTKVTLVNSLLLPIIDYADVCYPDLTEELLDKLDRLLNLCIRYIFGLQHNVAGYSDSFTVTAVRLWNKLPLDIRQTKSIDLFKSKVRLHYLQEQNILPN
ncbi:unnamed protein product [Plutella xylostella]|uniref:(diamondback moth) hypothetical protein n=1 Tax=Plutella xylostella TaxID=51655 RepID=A0A8S4G781_PLUXY|nr:unnamed protein product [Plutella xylostella]